MNLSHYISVFYNKYYPLTVYNRLRAQRRIKNKDFSLFCGDCMGGIISHQLGLPFLSPTVNMRIFQNDFYKLLLNLKEYLDSDEMVEVPNPNPGESCPTAMLKDILLTFTHFRTYEDGKKAWYRRCKKVNYDNLWIIATDYDGITEEDIAALQTVPCRGLVVFTSKKLDYPYCFYMPQFEGQPHVGDLMQKTIWGKRYFENYFDYVGWLNSDDPVVEHFRIR